MKLKYDFVITDMGEEFDAVPVGKNAVEFHGMLRLNQTGAELLELLKNETDPNVLLAEMMKKYPDSPKDDIGAFIADFLNHLIAEGILVK